MLESKNNQDPNSIFKSKLPNVKKSFLARLWQYLCLSNEQRFSSIESLSEKEEDKVKILKHSDKDKEINSYIEAEMLSMVLDIINNGYILNETLTKKFDYKVIELLENFKAKELLELHKKGYVMQYDILLAGAKKYLSQCANDKYYSLMNGGKNHPMLVFFKENYLEIINTPEFAKELIDNLKKEILCNQRYSKSESYSYLNKSAKNYYHGFKEVFYPLLQNNIDFKQYLDCSLEMKSISLSVYELMRKDMLKDESKINTIVESFKNVSLHNKIQQKVISNAVKEANKFNTKTLPEESQKIIQEIENKLKLCIQSKTQINEVSWNTINRLVEDKLPIIIKKYLNLDEEDLATLKNVQGQTPYEILNASLNNILNVINDTVKELKQQNVNELSVLHRYTQEVAKDYS